MRLALLLVAELVLAVASDGSGESFHEIEPGGVVARNLRVPAETEVSVGVVSRKESVICSIADEDGRIVTRTAGVTCQLGFTTNYPGKYRIGVINEGKLLAPITMTATW